jgi:hypothetical protein
MVQPGPGLSLSQVAEPTGLRQAAARRGRDLPRAVAYEWQEPTASRSDGWGFRQSHGYRKYIDRRPRVAANPNHGKGFQRARRTRPPAGCAARTRMEAVKIYIVHHVQHMPEDDGSVRHDENGVVIWDEQAGDDVKILGRYTSEERARDRVEHARLLPGFLEEPDCFYVSECVLDEDDWTEGFVTDAVD